MHSDAEIADRTLAGDRQAFEIIVQRHERAIYVHLIRMTGQPEDAEDLTQETFLRALRGLARYDGSRPLLPWLYRIATNAALSARRNQPLSVISLNSHNDLPDRDVIDPRSNQPISERLEREDLRLRLEQALGALSPEEGAVFNLRYHEGMSHKAIAAILGRKPGAVTVALHRLRLRLRRMVFNGATKEKTVCAAERKEP